MILAWASPFKKLLVSFFEVVDSASARHKQHQVGANSN